MAIFSANAGFVILHTKRKLKKIIFSTIFALVKKAEFGRKLTITISINVFVPCHTFLPIYKCSMPSGTYSVAMRTQKQRLGAKCGCQGTRGCSSGTTAKNPSSTLLTCSAICWVSLASTRFLVLDFLRVPKWVSGQFWLCPHSHRCFPLCLGWLRKQEWGTSVRKWNCLAVLLSIRPWISEQLGWPGGGLSQARFTPTWARFSLLCFSNFVSRLLRTREVHNASDQKCLHLCVCHHIFTTVYHCLSAYISMCTCLTVFLLALFFFFLALCEILWTYPFPFFSTTEVHLFFLGRYVCIKVSFWYSSCSSDVPLHSRWSVHAGMSQYSCALIFVLSRASFPVCVIHCLCLCASLCIFLLFPPSVLCAITWVCACMYLLVFIVRGLIFWWGGWWWNCLSFCFVFIFQCFPYVCIK